MARVLFTPNLERHIDCTPRDAAGGTVRDVLEAAFSNDPTARGYVLDDQGALRKHMSIFIDGDGVKDRQKLSDPVRDTSEVFIFQALSGG